MIYEIIIDLILVILIEITWIDRTDIVLFISILSSVKLSVE